MQEQKEDELKSNANYITFRSGELCSSLGCRCKRALEFIRSSDILSGGGAESSDATPATERGMYEK